MRSLIIAILLSTNANAESTVQPCAYARKLFTKIESSATPSNFSANGDVCTITWVPNGKAIAFSDETAERKAIMLELQALLKKTEEGKADVKDKDRALALIIRWISL